MERIIAGGTHRPVWNRCTERSGIGNTNAVPERAMQTLEEAVREASTGRVRPKIMAAATAILGLLPILVLRLHGTEIERPLVIVMTGGLITSTIFTPLALSTFYVAVHELPLGDAAKLGTNDDSAQPQCCAGLLTGRNPRPVAAPL
jgi:hypothetical protein